MNKSPDKNHIEDTVSIKPYKYTTCGIVTAKNVNDLVEHFDYKINIILKILSQFGEEEK